MSTASASSVPRLRPPTPVLVLLLCGVLLAHAALLSGAPAAALDAPAEVQPFLTRTIAAAAPVALHAPTTAPATAPTAAPRARTKVEAPLAAQAWPSEAPGAATLADSSAPSPGLAVEPQADSAAPAATAVQLAAAAPDPGSAPAPSASESARASGSAPYRFLAPKPVRLKYDIQGEVKGFPYWVKGELLWQHDASSYQARLEVSHFL
ncbi:MAG: hypothetical protein ACR2I0_02570, partial [Rhodoferax sp.]